MNASASRKADGSPASQEVVEPEIFPETRPEPWAGKTTPTLRKFFTGERALMTFFYVFSILMVIAILVAGYIGFESFQPQLMDPPLPR